MPKSTVDQIRRRFDADVERFAALETGQSATVDAPLALELIAQAAAVTTPAASTTASDSPSTRRRKFLGGWSPLQPGFQRQTRLPFPECCAAP